MTGAVELGVVMLCHADLDLAAHLARVWSQGGARVAIHLDAKVARPAADRMRQALADLDGVIFTPRHRCDWGRFSLVRATQAAAATLMDRFPELTHVYLASGSCLPLRPVNELRTYLGQDPERDHIESVTAREVGWTVGGLNEERFTLWFPFDWRKQRWLFDRFVQWQRRHSVSRSFPEGIAPHLGSQWWCLTTRTLRAILDDPRRQEFDRYFRLSWIPDESYFQTLVRRHSSRIESRSLTLARFDHKGRPYQLYDDHADLLGQSGCFVARKIWAGSTGLLQRFPEAKGAAEPSAKPVTRMFDRVVQRRQNGRPGLYMQSRYPRKDAENGKTSAPYAVFQGFSDVFPEFEAWLARHVRANVHGHLFSPDSIEFEGRVAIGPGAFPDNAALRDHDAQGFLTSLIRRSGRTQMFQFSPRDNQVLNWFIATDPNARLFIVTGAWVLPLLNSDMPFDDVRRVFARLQHAESEQLDVLNSIWVKARVTILDLPEFLADPKPVIAQAIAGLDPQARMPGALPDMRDMTGLPQLLRRLRNSGLRPDVGDEDALQELLTTNRRTAAE